MNKEGRLLNRIQRTLCGKRGFSMTELLVATLIMALATASLTSALILAFKHFYKSAQRTEAQFLCASLAEFVEDELSFSVASVDPDDGLTWSKGTHNMGSKICLYVEQTDGTYVKINETTLGPTNKYYGKIVITGDNYKNDDDTPMYYKLVTDGGYEVEKAKGYSLLAGMSLEWKPSKKWYEVKIEVVDKKDNTIVLSDEEFTVRPAVTD